MQSYLLALLAVFSLQTIPSLAPAALASDIVEKTVRFPAGESGTTITDRIKGYQSISYIVGASEGQYMTVRLKPSNLASYFNVYAPGRGPGDEALANAGMTGPMVPDLNEFAGELPESGNYIISVYMMRSAARRNEVSDFTLDISITGSAGAPQQSTDAMVPGTDFNATGIISCARNAGQPMGDCNFGVKREGNGNGMVTVFWPDGGSRVIFFENGTPAYFDQSQADGDAQMTSSENNDIFRISIGAERFEIFDAVINGG